MDLHVEPFSLRAITDAILETVADRCMRKNVELNALVHSDVCDHLKGDHGKLRQILVNLVGNAVKFTEAGEVRIEIKEVFRHHQTTTLEFRVVDTGIGFDNEEADELFESFRQSDSTAARKHGGTGLGLSITKQLTELLNGQVSAYGSPNVGAEFIVKIPFELSESPEPSETLKTDQVLIQILDVSNSAARSVANHLIFLGLPHEIVGSARQLSLSNNSQHRIIICDESSDWDPTSTAISPERNQDPSSSKFDIITMIPMNSQGANHGSEHILLKPVKFRSLKNVLINCLNPQENALSGKGRELADPEGGMRSAHPKFKHILIAEDNAVNQQVIREVFHRLGLDGTFVANGLEAIEAFQSQPYDCILMDCQMPELDGYETTRRIRQLEAQRTRLSDSHTTIIAMTANALFGDREKCLAAGMDDYLAKPIAVKDLESKLFREHPLEAPMHKTTNTPPTGDPKDPIKTALQKLVDDLGMEAVEMLVGEFLEDSSSRLETWRQGSDTQEPAKLRMEAHSLKSICQMYGMEKTAELAQQIESHCLTEAPDPSELASMSQELAQHLEREESQLKQFHKCQTESGDPAASVH